MQSWGEVLKAKSLTAFKGSFKTTIMKKLYTAIKEIYNMMGRRGLPKPRNPLLSL